MVPESHRGSWSGPNRLWFEDPNAPERSDGSMETDDATIGYSWAFRGEPQSGNFALAGPDAAVHAKWTDTWHAADGMDLYGSIHERLLRLTGTYPAGPDVEWGWLVELDFRDPEHVLLRMFNVEPGAEPAIAVDLHAARALQPHR